MTPGVTPIPTRSRRRQSCRRYSAPEASPEPPPGEPSPASPDELPPPPSDGPESVSPGPGPLSPTPPPPTRSATTPAAGGAEVTGSGAPVIPVNSRLLVTDTADEAKTSESMEPSSGESSLCRLSCVFLTGYASLTALARRPTGQAPPTFGAPAFSSLFSCLKNRLALVVLSIGNRRADLRHHRSSARYQKGRHHFGPGSSICRRPSRCSGGISQATCATT